MSPAEVSAGGLLEAALAACAGIALAAAAGMRVFVPLLAAAVAAHVGRIELAPGAAWLGSTPALAALAVAAVLEVGAYFVPALDHALDAIATPLAVVAGIAVSAATLVDVPVWLRWSLAVVAGGGAAGLVQGATTLLRLKSGVLTGGLANPAVALAELGGALVLALLALLLPVVAALAVVVVVAGCFGMARRVLFGRRPHAARPAGGAAA